MYSTIHEKQNDCDRKELMVMKDDGIMKSRKDRKSQGREIAVIRCRTIQTIWVAYPNFGVFCLIWLLNWPTPL